MSSIVLCAILTGLTAMLALILKIPVGPDCYIHLAEPIVFLSVIALPRKYACFAGPVGTALADLLGGYAFWAPWTLVVQLIVVLVFGFFLDIAMKKEDQKHYFGFPKFEFIGYLTACILGVIAYFFAEYLMFGNYIAAATCIPFRSILLISGSVICALVSKPIENSSLNQNLYYKRKRS